jgi:hypothetical protein
MTIKKTVIYLQKTGDFTKVRPPCPRQTSPEAGTKDFDGKPQEDGVT